eukprot:gene14172-biopygen5094
METFSAKWEVLLRPGGGGGSPPRRSSTAYPWGKRQRTRTGRGPDAGRTIEFEETGADRTRTGRGRGRFSLHSLPLAGCAVERKHSDTRRAD